MSGNDKFVTQDAPSDPLEKMPGTYKDDVQNIPMTERTLESVLPKAPDPSPFKLGPMGPSGR